MTDHTEKKFLELNSISVNYGNVLAVDNVSIFVKKQEIITIIGANGAGKSSILMAISGVVQISKGEVLFDGLPIQQYPTKKIADLGVVQVPEGRRIFPHLTVLENLELGAYLRKNSHEIKEDMNYVFELFPILKDRLRQTGGTLSGGEQQMLAIARALMQDPKVLCLDEPSLGLAPIIIQKIFNMLDRLREEKNITIILVEQNVNLALKHSDRAYVLETGKLVMQDESSKLQQNEKIREVYLGGHTEK